MKKIVLTFFVFVITLPMAFTQATVPVGSSTALPSDLEIQQRLLLAISSEAYPVTPGDVYRLTYRQGELPVTNDFIVESDYTINMKVFGKTNATGMTFAQLKPIVEKAVATAYPRSMPTFVILSLGLFQVYVKGETPQSQSVVAWGLSRLSEIIDTRRGPYASLRNVSVLARDGTQKTYDLFKAFRFGITAQDPYVKPGDTIVLSRSERRVEIAGAVHQPGTYELLANEQLRDLVESYGDGLIDSSDVSRIRIQRMTGAQARVLYMSLTEGYRQGVILQNGDIITIPALTESLPVVSFEGAVIQDAAGGAASSGTLEAAEAGVTSVYHVINYTFTEGETLSDALRAIRGSIAPLADLSTASVLREGTTDPVPVDLRVLLTDPVSPSDMVLKVNDRIIIPYLRFSVFISGAVEEPGTYPYAPGRTYHYYVALAGGSTQDAPDKVYITDVDGKMRDLKETIQPEDRIFLIPADIMVQGAVFTPGGFPYREGLPVSYYVNLAGGIDPTRNCNRKVRHYDSSGNRRKAGDPVMPGDRLYVPENGFVYTFNRYAPILVTILGLIVTSFEVYDLFAP